MYKNRTILHNKVDWINTSFLLLSPIIAIVGTVYLYQTGQIRPATVVLAVIMAIITGIAVTAGYHRLFSHKAYEANPLFKAIMLLFGAAAFENAARRWASDHRNHHKFVDTDLDPYNIKRGFFFAHMGWVMMKYDNKHRYDLNTQDLKKDWMIMFQEKHIFTIGILVGFVLPTAIASLWGDPLGGFILAGWLRMVLNHHFTFSINSFCHMLGSQPYSDQNTARDSWLLALVTYGEGYHNFHHKFPSDYRNGIKFFHWDPTKWLIKGLSIAGFTFNLRKISDDKILLAKVRMDEKRVVSQLHASVKTKPILNPEIVVTARMKFEEAYLRFQTLKAEYSQFKKQKLNEWSAQWEERRQHLINELHRAEAALKEAMAHWSDLCHSFGVRPTLAAI